MAFSVNTPVGDGVTKQFAVNFTNGLFSRDSVHVFVEGEVDGLGEPVERTFTWINDGLIELDGAAPGAGVVVNIRRIMDKNGPAVDFADGEILTEATADRGLDHLLNSIHELIDGYGFGSIRTDMNLNGNLIRNLGEPTEPTDAARLSDISESASAAVLRQELQSGDPAQGSDLVAHTGTTDTVTEALDKRTIFAEGRTELKTVTAAVGTNVYLIEGGRSGPFVIKSGTPPSDPQEGIYVVLYNGNYAERVQKSPFNVKWFGAIGDHTTNDTVAIKAAIEATIGGKLVFPPGTYRFDEQIYIKDNNVHLEGESAATTFLNYDGPENTFAIKVQREDFATATSNPFLTSVRIENFTINPLKRSHSILHYSNVTRGIVRNILVPNGINDNDGFGQVGFLFEGGVFNTIERLYCNGNRAPVTTVGDTMFEFRAAAWGTVPTASVMTNCKISEIYAAYAKVGIKYQSISDARDFTAEQCDVGIKVSNEGSSFGSFFSPYFEYNNYDFELDAFQGTTVIGNCHVYSPYTIGYRTAMVKAETGCMTIHGLRRYQQSAYGPLLSYPTTINGFRRLFVSIDTFPPTAKLLPDSVSGFTVDGFRQSGVNQLDSVDNTLTYKNLICGTDRVEEVSFIGPDADGVVGVKPLSLPGNLTSYRVTQPADILAAFFSTESQSSGLTFNSPTIKVNGTALLTGVNATIDGITYQTYPRRHQLNAGDVITIEAGYPAATGEGLNCKLVLGFKPNFSLNPN